MATFNWDNPNMPPTNTVITTIASAATTAMLLRAVASDILPDQLSSAISSKFKALSKMIFTQLTVVIDEYNGISPNHMFQASNIYLGAKICSSSARRVKASKSEKEKEVVVEVDKDEELVDWFDGIKLTWVMLGGVGEKGGSSQGKKRRETGSGGLVKSEVRWLELRFHKKHKDLVLSRYLRHVLTEAKKIKESRKEIKLYTVDYNGTDYWSSINLDHPSTFDKIAMEPELKRGLIEDLDRFISRRDYYRRVGKAWKRGYLLYGPPGTGKSSLVAAMANYLKFDVYDLDLKEVQCNSDLRRLLIGTASKSILVIEDIDCSVNLQNRADEGGGVDSFNEEKVSLSGLLNFIDGLWSTCGEERIIVFTTNHKDRLDPALLRPGRMDLHIHMSYCTFQEFKLLAANYLEIEDHPLYKEIKELFDLVRVTPAQVANELMKSDHPEVSLQGIISFLKTLSRENQGQ